MKPVSGEAPKMGFREHTEQSLMKLFLSDLLSVFLASVFPLGSPIMPLRKRPDLAMLALVTIENLLTETKRLNT